MDYGRILSDAWRLVWRFKALWVFGFITSLCSGTAGGVPRFNFNSRTNQLPPGLTQWLTLLQRPLVIVTLILLGLVLAAIALLIRSIAEGAMIGMVQEAEETGQTSFGSGLSIGTRHAGTIFVTEILLSLPILLLVVLAIVPIVLAALGVGAAASRRVALGPAILSALALVCGVLCISILVSILIYFIRSNALRAIVIDDRGVFGSIGLGWRVFWSHVGDFILLAVVLVILGFIVSVVIGIPLAAIGGLSVLSLLAALARGEALRPAVPLAVIGISLVAILVGSIFSGAVLAYASAVWTLAYRAATGRGRVTAPPPTVPAGPAPEWS